VNEKSVAKLGLVSVMSGAALSSPPAERRKASARGIHNSIAGGASLDEIPTRWRLLPTTQRIDQQCGENWEESAAMLARCSQTE